MAKKRIIKKRITMKNKLAVRARKEGFRARSVYKLKEIDNHFKLIKKGNIVVDLGAWPGSWLQHAVSRAGEGGVLVGIDLKPIDKLPQDNIYTIVGDIDKDMDRILEELEELAPRKVDVVLSDMAPSTTGIREVDQHKSFELCMLALEFATIVLKRNGRILCKIFESDESAEFVKELKKNFRYVKVVRPTATKKRSKEIFVVGKRFKG